MVREKVLVVDDEKLVCTLLATGLGEHGYTVDVADGVANARILLMKNKYGVVILDKNMPDSEGHNEGGRELLAFIKGEGQNFSAEVIMVTGFASVESAVEAMQNGAFDYIQKPFKIQDLMFKIDRAYKFQELGVESFVARVQKEKALTAYTQEQKIKKIGDYLKQLKKLIPADHPAQALIEKIEQL